MSWLAVSLALSVVLTVLLNVALRAFPGAGRRFAEGLTRLTPPTPGEPGTGDRRTRVWVPWKAMILASVILTVVVNVVLWFT